MCKWLFGKAAEVEEAVADGAVRRSLECNLGQTRGKKSSKKQHKKDDDKIPRFGGMPRWPFSCREG